MTQKWPSQFLRLKMVDGLVTEYMLTRTAARMLEYFRSMRNGMVIRVTYTAVPKILKSPTKSISSKGIGQRGSSITQVHIKNS